MNKKGVLWLYLIAIVLGIVIVIMVSSNLALRECSNNGDCPDDSYCSSNYQCIQYPEQIVVKQNNYLPAAIVLGVSMMVAAYIFRKGDLKFNKKED